LPSGTTAARRFKRQLGDAWPKTREEQITHFGDVVVTALAGIRDDLLDRYEGSVLETEKLPVLVGSRGSGEAPRSSNGHVIGRSSCSNGDGICSCSSLDKRDDSTIMNTTSTTHVNTISYHQGDEGRNGAEGLDH